MDPNVPAGAAILLDFIGDIEAPEGYATLYGNNHRKLAKSITERTIDEVIAAGPSWTKRFGSSAAGRYQFMNATLKGLKKELGLRGSQVFTPDLQDRLAYHLLKRRGYEGFMAKTIGPVEFAKRLAMEWASLPVLTDTQGAHRKLKRGQSYYAGDGLNKSLVQPERVEIILGIVMAGKPTPVPVDVPPTPEPVTPTAPDRTGLGWVIAWAIAAVLTGLVMIGAAAWHFIVTVSTSIMEWMF